MKLFSNKEDCTGCTACFSICPKNAIQMLSDEEGFKYPTIGSECINCGKCVRVCPIKKQPSIYGKLEVPKVYAAKHKSESVRATSSSGGMFTAISDYVLQKNGIIYGVGFNEEFVVCHKKATDAETRNSLKGSKYVQSDLGNTFNDIKDELKRGRCVLFTGTPCQTAGLYKYLGNEVDISNLIVIDIVCHGTPSPLMWREYVSFLKKRYNDKIISIEFRDKRLGWRRSSLKVEMENKVYCQDMYKDGFYSLFFSYTIIRPSCHNCNFTNLNRQSDITIADFWGIEKCLPEFDDNKGVSLILVNTDKGKVLINDIKDSFYFEKSNPVDCMQPQLREPTKPSLFRKEFWSNYKDRGFIYVLKKYGNYGYRAKLKKLYKRVLKKLLKR